MITTVPKASGYGSEGAGSGLKSFPAVEVGQVSGLLSVLI